MKTKQPAHSRAGYVQAKHNAEGKRVKKMKKEAYAGAAAYQKASKEGGFIGRLKSLPAAYANRKKMDAAMAAERSHEKMRRVRFGDKKK